jgi:filamentous hemagglutinin family protein
MHFAQTYANWRIDQNHSPSLQFVTFIKFNNSKKINKMNANSYKVIFSKRLGALVAVGEHTSAAGKAASGQGSRDVSSGFMGAVHFIAACVIWAFAPPPVAFAQSNIASTTLPQGGTVGVGSAHISSSGAQMAISQTSNKASINWQSFNIGNDATVSIHQPNANSVLLNRVVSNDPSQILGKLSANGQVILLNPNGILFGKDGSVTASSFTASTFGMTDSDFSAGVNRYSRNGSTASVVNQGSLQSAPHGFVALIGATVTNEGKIIAPQGDVIMAAGERVTLPQELANTTPDTISVRMSKRVRLEIDPANINTAVNNTGSGVIVTEGGQVLLQAAALSRAVASVTHSGTIDTSAAQGGAVTLLAENGNIKVNGSIVANSTDANQTGGNIIIGRDDQTGTLAAYTDVSDAVLESRGALIETSAHTLDFSNVRKVTAKEWLLDPTDVTIDSAAAATIGATLGGGTSVTIQTDGSTAGTAGDGNILIRSNITANNTTNTTSTLTLTADNKIWGESSASTITGTSTGTGKVNVVMTANGNSAASTAGINGGIFLNEAINTTGTVSLTGTNKTTLSSNTQYAVRSAAITASSITINGYSTGSTSGIGSRIAGNLTATNGDVTIYGTGVTQWGTYVSGRVTSNTGAINITGLSTSGASGVELNGANLSADQNITIDNAAVVGVGKKNVIMNNATLSSTNGNTTITGNAANSVGISLSGPVTVNAGNLNLTGSSTSSTGIYMGAGANLVASNSGTSAVTMTGTSTNSVGVQIQGGSVTAAGNITLSGTSNAATNMQGLLIQNAITSTGGNITATGITAASNQRDLAITNDGSGGHFGSLSVTGANKSISLTADNMFINTGSIVSAGATGTVNIQTHTSGNQINLGGSDVMSATASSRVLGLDATEVGLITGNKINLDISTAGNIAINGALQAGNTGSLKNLTLNATGANSAVTQTSAVTAASLELLGSTTDYTLTNTNNAVGTLAANTKTLNYINAFALSVGTVNSTNGISTTGITSVATNTGNLSITQAVSTTSASASAMTLNAGLASNAGTSTGGDITVSGSGSVSVGANGVARLYSGSLSGTTGISALAASGSGKFRYNSDETLTNYTLALGTKSGANNGINVIYREAPTISITATNVSGLTYNGSTYSGTPGVTVSGVQNGDGAAALTGTTSYAYTQSGAAATPKNAGTYTIAASGQSSDLGYGVNYVNGTLTINKANLTLSGTREYDGTKTFAGDRLTATGVNNETFTVTGAGDATNLSSKNVQSASTLNSVTGLSLGTSSNGGLSSNYNPLSTTGSSASVTPKSATVTATATNLTYNGNTQNQAAESTNGFIAGDVITITGLASGLNANTYASNLQVAGADANNYTIAITNANLVIGKANLTITANNDSRFVTLADTVGFNGASYSGFVNGETETVLGGTLAITRQNANTDVAANTYKSVLVPSGLTSSNYDIHYTNGDYTIVPARVLLVRTANQTLTYGSTPIYNVTAQYLDGANVIHTLTQSGSGNSLTFNDGVEGSATITFSPYTGSSSPATSTSGNIVVGNYEIKDLNPTVVGRNFDGSPVFVGNLTIAQKALTANATNVSKVYDATTTMNNVTLGLTGNIANDKLTVNGSGAFAQKNAGTNLGYTISDLSLSGNDASNYYLIGNATSFTGTNGVITAAPLSLSTNNVTKIYDGTTMATGSLQILQGTQLFGTDSVSGGSFAFTTPSVGTNKTVQVTGVVINDGNNGKNYNVTYIDNIESTILTDNKPLSTRSDNCSTSGTCISQMNPFAVTREMLNFELNNLTKTYNKNTICKWNPYDIYRAKLICPSSNRVRISPLSNLSS